jgi:hypothetical protein
VRRLAAIAFGLIALSGAARADDVPLPGDMVKDAATAIRIGAHFCFGPDFAIAPDWHADLHGRVWDVWEGPNVKAGHDCPYSSASVNAADGKANCMECEALTIGH